MVIWTGDLMGFNGDLMGFNGDLDWWFLMGSNMDKHHMYGLVYHPLSIIRYTLWWTNIATENHHF